MSAYLLESAFCLVLAYGFYHIALRRETFFQWNRAFLLLAPLLALTLPALHIQVFTPVPTAPTVVVPPAQVIDLPTLVAQVQTAPTALRETLVQPVVKGWSWSVSDIVWSVYLIGMLVLLSRLVIRFWRLHLLLSRCRRERKGAITLAVPEEETVPLSSFFGTIFWKKAAEFTEKEQLMLAHELVHVRQWHSLDVLLMEMLVVVQWFNPLIHAFRHSLCAVHEYIADDYVVRQTRQRYQYATLLAEQATAGSAQPGVLVNTFHSLIKHRLLMLAKRPSRPLQRAKYLLALPLFAALMLLFSFRLVDRLPVAAPFRAVTQAVENYFTQLDAITIVADKPVPPTPPADPTPYIFYWGQIQCKITHSTATDTYSGEITLTPDLFKECLNREPRLYNGQSLEQKLAFSFADQSVQSDYNDEAVYASVQTKLKDYIETLKGDEYLELQDLRLPNGGNCTIRLYVVDKSPDWLPRKLVEYNWPFGQPDPNEGKKLQISWGDSPYDPDRQFYTAAEFWKILEQEPWVTNEETGVQKLESFGCYLYNVENNMPIMASLEDQRLPQLRTKMQEVAAKIQPGIALIIEGSIPRVKSFSSDTIIRVYGFGQSEPTLVRQTTESVRLGVFEIVPENDPRLLSRRSDKKNFRVKWGDYPSSSSTFYAKHVEINGKLVYWDHTISSHHFMLTRQGVLDMLKSPLHVYREEQLMPGFTYDFLYKNYKFHVENGLIPAELRTILENELQPYETIEIADLQSGEYDLNSLKIKFEVKAKDPKPPLRPANAPKMTSPEIILSISPNPVSEKTAVIFALSAAVRGSLQITDLQGKVIWTAEQDFVAGNNRIDLPFGELKTAGIYFMQLETALGIGRSSFVVQ